MPLRVVHVVHDYLPRHQAGSELYVAALCASQHALGHNPTVFAATYAPGHPQGALRWRAHEGMPVIEVVNNWEAGDFPETYDAGWLQRAFAHVLGTAEPHVVHVHNLLNLAFGLPALARGRGIPVVATLHDYTLACPSGGQRIHRRESHICHRIDPSRCARCFAESPFHAQWHFGRTTRALPGGSARRLAARAARIPLLSRVGRTIARASATPATTAVDIERRLDLAREVFGHFQRVVAPSRSLADEYRLLGFPTDRIEVSDYGFAPLERAAAPASATGRLRIGFMGTLVWHKGADVLVEAARLLPRDRVVVRLHGDEHVFPEYTRQIRARAGDLPVEFRGRFDHADVAAVLAELDVLVVPSRWLENSPLVIHEAFMARVPVVASAIGGIPDLLGAGAHGVLVPPDDPAALAGAL
ncbi:MAG TPA: glycosyltransferase, partial [Gemmatimonadaceae bacterium]|nr:glycosyltransferase [Gemmatimonadaceae bacterium]